MAVSGIYRECCIPPMECGKKGSSFSDSRACYDVCLTFAVPLLDRDLVSFEPSVSAVREKGPWAGGVEDILLVGLCGGVEVEMEGGRQPYSGANVTMLPGYTGARISGCWSLRSNGGGSGEDSLDRLLPPVRAPRRKSMTLGKAEPPLLRTGTRTIYTAGRPPWYDEHGAQSKEAFVIGLCGGSASGKTTVANKIIEALDVPWVVLLSMDSFYKVLTPEEQALAASNDYNFDHPGAFDFQLLVATLRKLKQGKQVKIPVYDFTTHSRHKDWKNLYGASVIIFEGIMSFADKELLQLAGKGSLHGYRSDAGGGTQIRRSGRGGERMWEKMKLWGRQRRRADVGEDEAVGKAEEASGCGRR
ncbi:hypothetical protein ACEWY4_000161 [Coilia grayii]|uniref:uridine/cytidine kinase n=1 Tax=Coilia grayii TaxID=363190 RepID=A0ABD1KX35_9TELE